MLLNLGWPLYAMSILLGVFVGSILLWSSFQPYRAKNRLYELWPDISGLEGQLKLAIDMDEMGQLKHCEKYIKYILPQLKKLKISTPGTIEITKENAKVWRGYLLRLAIAAKNKQIKEARSLRHFRI